MLWNCLLDGFPEDYKGYKIRSDFRIGIMLNLLLEDEAVDEDTKLSQAFNILYIDEVQDIQTAYDGLMWFLSCGESEIVYDYGIEDNKGNESNEKCIDYQYDALEIWGGFWSKGVDSTKTDMHWFAFNAALHNLQECVIAQRMDYRSMSTKDMKGDTKKHYNEIKKKVKVRKMYTKEEAEEIRRRNEKLQEEQNPNMSSYQKEYYRKMRELGAII